MLLSQCWWISKRISSFQKCVFRYCVRLLMRLIRSGWRGWYARLVIIWTRQIIEFKSFNSKLKFFIKHYSSIENFVHVFFLLLSVLRNKRNHKAAEMFQKTKIVSNEAGVLEYARHLISYASSFVIKQIDIRRGSKGGQKLQRTLNKITL